MVRGFVVLIGRPMRRCGLVLLCSGGWWARGLWNAPAAGLRSPHSAGVHTYTIHNLVAFNTPSHPSSPGHCPLPNGTAAHTTDQQVHLSNLTSHSLLQPATSPMQVSPTDWAEEYEVSGGIGLAPWSCVENAASVSSVYVWGMRLDPSIHSISSKLAFRTCLANRSSLAAIIV